ncbi:hypothetical protein FQZ97_956540 [compost metagenome]
MLEFGIDVPAQVLANNPARARQLVVPADPAIDMDGTHRGMQAARLHQAHHPRDGRVVQLGELAVVDGDVGLAPGAVLRQAGLRQLGQDALRHRLQACEVGLPRRGVLQVGLVQPTVRAA